MDALHTIDTEARRAAPARMEPLAKLPVFFGLDGKRVVVAGGSDGAAWKAELLVACGARVDLVCPEEELGDVMRGAIANHPASGDAAGIRHLDHPWHLGIFAGAAIALCDCETDEEAKAFYCAAKAAGVPVNVIDKPAFCEFQFGSIVNRSPVIISISTDGAAPILAQAIRRRIETLLPPTLKAWASIAQSVRAAINSRLKPGSQRRSFWEGFVDRVFRDIPGPSTPADLIDVADEIASAGAHQRYMAAPDRTPAGRVTLVGAGPGDAELLTLKAVRALQAADVILFDDLVSDDVLELARREARRMLVGKRGGRESCKQEDINATMIALAKAGKRVVRLKSGDPMIFGRAGEEIECLERQGIPVDIVPGVTAATAMAARLGVSLTHRDHAQSVRFVTGHSRKGELPTTLNWQQLADPSVSTVFYMGGRTAGAITQHLTENGMDPLTPAVIVSAIARQDERRWAGPLHQMPTAMAEIGYDNPVLIAIGDAFIKAQRHGLGNVSDGDERRVNSASG
ncbi:siroheme synthase CysG [Rhizobium sp. SSA_523]|uniref:siroheme synthase CysG n=1 Tax=Rhizobium sp. SSA_523 TaxID=2952477 RepID=UPI0020914E6A|nr:siroheme synthase CysG [Rhizobium sp. SSA_523]MCO5731672.1 siroheme synthase CysG [Rhizobium sp. SSA_523]WKC22951.1 siroheme synthase CysG [Rhizobium sp. SSA_523]